jgi:cytochrome c biogenesis protein CcmG/thiol:disulfide interchange protein DsbE
MRRLRDFGLLSAFVCASWAATPAPLPAELSFLQGRVIYLDFWASWCTPCRQSFPWMQALQTEYASRGLTVIAVNLDQDRAAADTFLQRFHPGFQIHFDSQGRWAEQFGVKGMPTSVVIDRHGVPRFTHIGFLPDDRQAYTRHVEQLLAEQ